MEKAVAAARAAFQPGSAWRKKDASARGVMINKLADLVQKNIIMLAVSRMIQLYTAQYTFYTCMYILHNMASISIIATIKTCT